ncbi:MORN repeat-containing protein 4-like [Limulus polyphemus]|uniref:MORN repeat-containing protein 4-like n=1 Tax=Limulus polyphemus TaxID=6850 RepID=A0ABM1B6L5_LIMPO|nr:MORN repeat-containing protein 4-like [Limulus polyphemus]
MSDQGENVKKEDVEVVGSFTYPDGMEYVGQWDEKGQKQGMGHLKFPGGTVYVGRFENGMPSGLGVLSFPDHAKYEGEFMQGWFHGHGTFWRNDGMRFEGEFRGGRIWGYGLVTFADGSNGFPRCEGLFKDCRLVKRCRCIDIVLQAQKVAMAARAQCQQEPIMDN